MQTKLSVILPVYNGMPYLPEAVESILTQTFTDFTFIIVNDGSTDGSGAYLSGISDPRVVVIEHKNAGQGAARKTALSQCLSEYVALMDADDVSLPNRLAIQIAFLEDHPDTVMVGTQFNFLILGTIQRALRAPAEHAQILARLMKGRAGLCTPSLMFRRNNALACIDYPDGHLGEDIYFCLRMCDQGTVANLDKILMLYRMHSDQTSLSRTKEIVIGNHYAVHLAVYRGLGKAPPRFEDFILETTWKDRWRWAEEARTITQYRTGRLELATGRQIRGYLRLMLLALRRPAHSIRRLIQTARSSVTVSLS
jgi:glycosyltransferase involved in cell wall biosynthesis